MAGFKNGLKKVGRVWHYKFKFKKRNYHGSTGFESYEDASHWLLEYRLALRKKGTSMAEVPTFGALWEMYTRDNTHSSDTSKACTANSIKRWVLPILGHLTVSEIGPEQIGEVKRRYLTTQRSNGKYHTIGGVMKVLTDTRTVLNWSKQYPEFEGLRIVKIQLPSVQEKVVTTIPSSMVEDFVEAVGQPPTDAQPALAVRIMLMMGLRIGEIISMRWEWFSYDCSNYTPGLTKGREAETLPVIPELAPFIRAWKKEATQYWEKRGRELPPLVFFERSNGQTLRKNSTKHKPGEYWKAHGPAFCTKRIKAAARKLGLAGAWGPHKLRHSFATLLAECGVADSVIQELLRHKDVKTTKRYIHISKMLRQTAMDRFSAGLQAARNKLNPGAPSASIPTLGTLIHLLWPAPRSEAELEELEAFSPS